MELRRISNKRLPLEDMLKPDQFFDDVKATIDQILERVVVTQDKDRPIASLLSLSRLKLPTLRDKGSIDDAKNGQKKVASSYPDRKTILLSDLEASQARPASEFRNSETRPSPAERDNGGRGLKKGPKAMDITQDITSPTSSETINTVKQDLRPVRDFLPDYPINQVGKQISRSILIKPPELGVLKVEMDIKGNILKLGMIAENSSIKELLPSNVHEPREPLVEQGVKLDRLDVQINNNSGQSLTNSKEGQGQELIGGPFIAEDDTEDPISDSRNMATGDHLLDLVA
jgi:flagellar hook-length control protein FliK